MNQDQPIVTALLSYGMSGEVFHAPLLHVLPEFRMKSILQRKSEAAKAHYPGVIIVKSMEDILNDPDIELVVINTPNETHFEFAAKALQSGKNIIVEKPFTSTVAEAEKLIALASEKKKLISVFQSRRWDGNFMTLQQVIASGKLGQIVSFEAHYDRFRNFITPNTWKEEAGPGSGILYNLGSHMIDQALVLFGKPKAVTAWVGIERPGGKVDDFYDIHLEYPSLKVILKSSYLVKEPGPFYTVHGVNGSFVKFGIDPQEDALKLHQVPGTPGWGTEPENLWGKINTEKDSVQFEGRIETLPGNYLGYYKNIHQAIRHHAPLAVPAAQGMEVIKVIEAAQRSNQERKTILY